jgi:hypothetical protein
MWIPSIFLPDFPNYFIITKLSLPLVLATQDIRSKKSERSVPKLSVFPLALPSQRDACAKKLRTGKPLLNEHASSYLDNQHSFGKSVCGREFYQKWLLSTSGRREPQKNELTPGLAILGSCDQGALAWYAMCEQWRKIRDGKSACIGQCQGYQPAVSAL